MSLSDTHRSNFETLLRAVQDGALALMECQRRTDGAVVAALCAVNFDGTEYEMVPFAVLVDDPYATLNPPAPDGGFHSEA